MSGYESRSADQSGGQETGKRKGSLFGKVFATLLLLCASAVFCYAAWMLYGYYRDYKAGSDEYRRLEDQFTRMDEDGASGSAGRSGSGTDASGSGKAAGSAAKGTFGSSGGAAGSAAAEASSEAPDELSSEWPEEDSSEMLSGSEAESESLSESGGSAGSGTAVEYVPKLHGETGRRGLLLRRVEELEDPKTLEKQVEKAAAVNTEENREKKQLPVLRNPIDFEELEKINPEIIGWIRIGALDKSYPVAQAKDNEYYLHRTFEKKDNFAGCIFLNCENSRFFTDQNTIVYGHNMKDGSMFGTLKNFGTQETYDRNPYFWIFTKKYIYQYQIFSCSIVSKIGDPYRIRFMTEEFEEFLKSCAEKSQVDAHGLKPTVKDRVVTLSTCTGDDSTRFIVQGMLRQIYAAR